MKAFRRFVVSSSLLGDEVAKYGHAPLPEEGVNLRLDFLREVASSCREEWEGIGANAGLVVVVGGRIPCAKPDLPLQKVVSIQEWIESWIEAPTEVGGSAHAVYTSRRELALAARAARRLDVEKWAESYYRLKKKESRPNQAAFLFLSLALQLQIASYIPYTFFTCIVLIY